MDKERVNFFSVDMAKHSDDLEPDCCGFLTDSIPDSQRGSMDRTAEDIERIERKASLPAPLEVIKDICLCLCVVLLVSLPGGMPLTERIKNAPVRAVFAGVSFIVWLALFIRSRIFARRFAKNAESYAEEAEKLASPVMERSKELLGVPGNAASIDVLFEGYKMINGKRRFRPVALCRYVNIPLYAFADRCSLCLTDLRQRWEIPLSSLGSAELVNKRVSFPNWNKDKPCTDEEYKPYDITADNFGRYYARCYRIDINDARGRYFLLVPEYDGDAIMKLAGITPDTQ